MGNIKSMSKINGYSQIKQEPHKTKPKTKSLGWNLLQMLKGIEFERRNEVGESIQGCSKSWNSQNPTLTLLHLHADPINSGGGGG